MIEQKEPMQGITDIIRTYFDLDPELQAEKIIKYLNDNKEREYKMEKVKCPYSEVCCDVDSEKCKSCLNNKKRSYYVPERPSFTYYNPNYTWLGVPDYGTTPITPDTTSGSTNSFFVK